MNTPIYKRYTDEQLINILNMSASFKDFIEKLGYKTKTGDLYKTIKRYLVEKNIKIPEYIKTTRKITESDVFCKDSTVDQTTVRKYYKRKNDINYKCCICGLMPIWNNKELTLILDHINGDNHDNRIDNLRWVCPNCDTQNVTYKSKNIKR